MRIMLRLLINIWNIINGYFVIY